MMPAASGPVTIGRPPLTYRGPATGRASTELLSVVQELTRPGDRVLDAGCGAGDFKTPIRNVLGRKYVGLDLRGPRADVLADASRLPFSDESFDGVLSYAMLQYLPDPFAGMREFARVLKPGGVGIVTVGFGEPFVHDLFRVTHLGMIALARAADLVPERIWACRDVLSAYSNYTSPYPRVVKWLLPPLERLARCTALTPRRWLDGGTNREERALLSAGSFGCIARKRS
jgi:ubiquinone/menaquinone biosynthesis C-methylase UbiE